MPRGDAGGTDDGSAIAEFVMVSALLLFVVLAVLQLAVALYIRNTLISAASEGARFGARMDASPDDGAFRAEGLIAASLNASFAQDVSAGVARTMEGVQVVVVTVTAPLPLIGPIGPAGGLTVSGRAFSETQVSGPAGAGSR
ncbi:TadE/TadG family type IV pilus assembly protein [Intrasporangium calvum]|nr:TadE/TadG family type IV pilus assembly protein [Intrasporangium calvum]